jgi:hypothetical protein
VSVAHVLKVLKCYTAFTADVTFATKVTFDRVDDGAVTVSFALGVYFYPGYIAGTGTGEDIAAFFENEINTDVGAPIDYETVVRVGNTLYIYSYDAGASFSDSVVANSTDTSLVTTTVTNLQNKTSEILDVWNSITYEQLCCLLDFANNQVKIEVGAQGSNPCNC